MLMLFQGFTLYPFNSQIEMYFLFYTFSLMCWCYFGWGTETTSSQTLKGIFYPKMKILSLIIYPHIRADPPYTQNTQAA